MQKKGVENGTHEIALLPSYGNGEFKYVLQFTVYDENGAVAAPAAGTAQLKASVDPAAPTEVIGAAIDLTDRTEWLHFMSAPFFPKFEVVIATLTVDYTLDIRVIAST